MPGEIDHAIAPAVGASSLPWAEYRLSKEALGLQGPEQEHGSTLPECSLRFRSRMTTLER